MRLLFIPVSAPRGTGEYARAVAIASEVKRRLPEADIRFVVSREASYAESVPFHTTLLPSSPTFHVRQVVQLMTGFRPDLVIFDNAGRTAQLRAARAVGARVVFVSSRERQRRRAFRVRWMPLIDEHWIALPELLAGSLSLLERLKLRILRRPRVRYLDTLLPHEVGDAAANALARYRVRSNEFVLVVPGGGAGHRRMKEAPEIIGRAARKVAQRGNTTLLVGIGAIPGDGPVPETLQLLPGLPMTELIALIRHAKLVVVNGADTLLQVLACERPCVAVPMAPDQVRRLARLDRAGLHVGVRLDAADIERRAVQLLDDDLARRMLVEDAARLHIANAMETVQGSIARLLTRNGCA